MEKQEMTTDFKQEIISKAELTFEEEEEVVNSFTYPNEEELRGIRERFAMGTVGALQWHAVVSPGLLTVLT